MNFQGLSRQQMIVLGIAGALVLILVLGIMGILPLFKSTTTDPNFPSGPVILTMWGVDNQADFADVFTAYQALPQAKNVKILYTQFNSVSQYEQALVNALAEGKGPDIFMVKNTWAYKDAAKGAPAPTTLVTPLMVQQNFPAVVGQDFLLQASNGQQYAFALPLYMDALGLIYNKDIFNTRGIVYPPQTWDQVLADVQQTRVQDASKNITQAGIALGSAVNITNVSDILSALILQQGSSIYTAAQGGVSLQTAAQQAVSFFLQFANPTNPYYTWNDGMPDARTAFANGTVAMILDTHDALATMAEKNPFMHAAIAPLPQLASANAATTKNYASYWGLAVSRQSQNQYVAWHFIRFATMTPSVDTLYLQKANRFPALLSLIQAQESGPDEAFIKSFLTATSWKQADDEKISAIFNQMIEDVTSGKAVLGKALQAAEADINALYTH